MHFLIRPGEGFLLCESRGQPRKGNDTWLAKAPSLFPEGWAGQAVSEQSQSVLGHTDGKITEGSQKWPTLHISSQRNDHKDHRAGLWLFPHNSEMLQGWWNPSLSDSKVQFLSTLLHSCRSVSLYPVQTSIAALASMSSFFLWLQGHEQAQLPQVLYFRFLTKKSR